MGDKPFIQQGTPDDLRAIRTSPDAKVVGKAVNEEISGVLDVQLYTVRHPIELAVIAVARVNSCWCVYCIQWP